MNKTNKTKLPVFGIGPIFVITCLVITICGLALKQRGFLRSGDIAEFKMVMVAIGVILILSGIALWIKAVLLQKIGDEIKAGHLVTTGAYAIVRNPIYSAFLFVFAGVLCAASNLYLLILPFAFWVYLTVLICLTEEKWLKAKFGDEYTQYCSKVNRVVPRLRQSK